MRYKVTTLFSIPDYYEMRKRIFGEAQPDFEEFTPNGSTFLIGFASPQTPADLGPLVKVELIS